MKIRRDSRKIDILLHLLGQNPQGILQNYYIARDNGEEYPSTFQHATDLLKATYMAVDPSVEAVRKVETVKQEGSQLFAQYVEKMNPFFEKCQLGNVAIIHFIKKNMNQGLRNRMAGRDGMSITTYQAFTQWVIKYETSLIRDGGWSYGPREGQQTRQRRYNLGSNLQSITSPITTI